MLTITGGPRSDLNAAAHMPMFWVKLAFPTLVLVAALFTAGRLINMIIAVNTEVIPLKDAPKSWKDFPDVGKKAAMGNPLYSGSNFVTVAAFVKKDGNWSWFERARAKGVAVLRGNSEAATALAGKEFGVAMTLDYIVQGLINKEIASRLDVSESVVKNTLQQLFAKTGVRTRSQLVRIALEQYRNQL